MPDSLARRAWRAGRAGYASFHLADHHGSALRMAPTREIFIAAASQVTETIRFGRW
jgi:alkanesulfonate monooxygenase SsuD/methylene tetrahydromethanopterin reductase-like flavin-dependent oxidoreductase (luciferase family)